MQGYRAFLQNCLEYFYKIFFIAVLHEFECDDRTPLTLYLEILYIFELGYMRQTF